MRALIATLLALTVVAMAGQRLSAEPADDPIELLVASSRPADGGKQSSRSVPAAATQSSVAAIKVAAILPLSGALAPLGQSARRGLEQAVANFARQAEADEPRIRLVLLDSESRTVQSADQARKAVMVEQADVLIGGLDGPAALAIRPIAQQSRTPFLVLYGGYRPAPGEGPFTVRVGTSTESLVDGLVQYARESLKAGRLFAISDVSNDRLSLAAERFVQTARKARAESVTLGSLSANREPDRLDELARQACDQRCEAVFASLPADSLVKFAAQLRRRKSQATLLLAPADWDIQTLLSGDADGIGQALVAVEFAEDDPDPAIGDWLADFTERFSGRRPDAIAATAYECMLLVRDLARRRAKTGGDLRDRIATTVSVPGIRGPMRRDEEGQIIRPVAICRLVPADAPATGQQLKFVARLARQTATQPEKK